MPMVGVGKIPRPSGTRTMPRRIRFSGGMPTMLSPSHRTSPAAGWITPDTIRSEISCKFTQETANDMLQEGGLRLVRWYTDPEQLFGLALAQPEE